MVELESLEVDKLSDFELRELISLTDKWSDNIADSRLMIYEPNPVMRYFHFSKAKTKAMFGGNRSGKTFSSIIELGMHFTGVVPKSLQGLQLPFPPNVRIRHCSADYPNIFEKVIWPTIKTIIPTDYIVDVVKEQGRIKAITNKYGGFIEFMFYEQPLTKFYGASRHIVCYDEEPPESIRDENMMRLIDANGHEYFFFTPVSEIDRPMIWAYDKLLKAASRIVEKIGDKISDISVPDGDPETHAFFASIYDNRSLDHKIIDRILAKYDKNEREVRSLGHFMCQSGLVYKGFNEELHLIDPFTDWIKSDDYTLYVAIDPHPRVPHAALFMVARRDGILFLVDELYSEADTAADLVQMIKAKCMGKPVECILIDPLAYTRDPSTNSCFAYDLADAGLYPIPISSSKDKSRGIIKVKELLATPGAFFVNRECKRFYYEITHWVWDAWKKDTDNVKGIKQKPIDKNDHTMECLYRLVLLNPRHVSPYNYEEAVKDI